MKAVILAAGVGSRLRPITSNKPKCMIKVAGRPILDYQIRAYASAGIRDIVIVAGYEAVRVKEFCKHIKDVNIKIIDNPDYESTNNMYSLYLAARAVEGEEFILSNGDVVFDARIAHEVVSSPESDFIVADKGSWSEESMKITLSPSGCIDDISKKIGAKRAYGNSIDLYRFSAPSSTLLFGHIRNIIERENNLKDWAEVAIQDLLRSGRLRMSPFDVAKKPWVEIDNYEDLALGDKTFSGFDLTLKSKKLFFIDLDGTVFLGDQVIPGAAEFLEKLQAMGMPYYFLSNNSSRSKGDYVGKLSSMGIKAAEESIILSTDGLVNSLIDNRIKDVFVLGTESMRRSIAGHGINIDSENPEFIVLGYDTELNYDKLKRAALHLHNGADLLATHCDTVCPTPEGPIPDIGATLALLEAATGKKPFKVFGKPNPEMVEHVIQRHGTNAVVFAGDRISTDMEMAHRVNAAFILVLSGETRREEVEHNDRMPDLIVNSLGDIF